MKQILQVCNEFRKNDLGATMVEYALMVSLVAVACVAAVTAMSGALQNLFNSVVTSL
jgi:pilus assembly protein Flp/PilA